MKPVISSNTATIRIKGLQAWIISLFALILIGGCGSLIATYDNYAYTKTIDIKVELLYLMEQADEPFGSHREEVKALQLNIDKVYEYEKGRSKNQITVAMWEKFIAPDGYLFGGFIKRWEAKEVLLPVFIKESKKTISAAIDQIIGLESGKIKKSDLGN